MRIDYPIAQRHGDIRRLLPDFFSVSGSAKLAPGVVINRNMGIARNGDDLLLINPVRLCARVEEKLLDLGQIRHAVRLGYHHGCDDLYYRDKFNLTFWRQAGSDLYPVPEADNPLCEGGEAPFPGGRVFEFRRARYPEAALLLPMDGGLLLCCDSLQYQRDWSRCSFAAKWLLRFAGFRRGVQVAPTWVRRMTPEREDPGRWLRDDFQRLLQLPFAHLLAAHGDFCADTAHHQVERAVQRSFPDS